MASNYNHQYFILMNDMGGVLVQLDALSSSLNIKGIREKALQKQLEKYYVKIRYVIFTCPHHGQLASGESSECGLTLHVTH